MQIVYVFYLLVRFEWFVLCDELVFEFEFVIVDVYYYLWDCQIGCYFVDEFGVDVCGGYWIVLMVYVQCCLMLCVSGLVVFKLVGEVVFVSGIVVMFDSGVYGFMCCCEVIVGGVDLLFGVEFDVVFDMMLQVFGG